jgi:hypothetical protein
MLLNARPFPLLKTISVLAVLFNRLSASNRTLFSGTVLVSPFFAYAASTVIERRSRSTLAWDLILAQLSKGFSSHIGISRSDSGLR